MAKNIKNDKSNSYIYNFSKTGNEDAYYMVQILFSTKEYMLDWDVTVKGYYLVIVNVKFDKETKTPHSPNFLFSDVSLLVPCERRSEANFNKALEMMQEVAEKRIEIMEKDKETFRQMGVKDEEIDNMVEKIRKAMQEENIEKKESDNVKKEVLRAEPVEDKKEEVKKNNEVYLSDIAGHKEIKEEVMEIIDAFHNKEKYEKFGIKMNLNIIFEGVSGTGKTMFAKAIANECGVNFIQASGSEFCEKFVGVGAKRVRELYEKARAKAPCIVFIDEAETVLRKRSSEDSGREQGQTLNQFLVELDGMSTTDDVITIVATNRIDMIDEAVLRPGRLTRHITVPPLDIEGRRELLKIYAKSKPLADDVDLERIAKMTSGFVGAELFNLINEACIFAVRGNQDTVTMSNFEKAYEKISTGLTSQTKKLNEEEKMITAIHECGHALVSYSLNNQCISKLSILPRNNDTLGFVLYEHNEETDRYMQTKEDLENKIKSILGGKVAEKIVFNEFTSGCANDLEKVKNIAYHMVTSYGMSSLGSFAIDSTICSEEKIYNEINKIVGKCYKECKALLKENLDILEELAKYVVEEEEITGKQFEEIYNEILEKRNEIND